MIRRVKNQPDAQSQALTMGLDFHFFFGNPGVTVLRENPDFWVAEGVKRRVEEAVNTVFRASDGYLYGEG